MVSSKYLKLITLLLLSLAIILSSVMIFMPKKGSEPIVKQYETKIFDKNSVMSISIDMDETKWNEMIKNALKEEYYPCNITINGTTFKNVGIRAKGNTSLTMVANSDSDRYSFKIKFDEYVDGQTCFGLNKLVLNNTYSDKTYMKEYLSYEIMDYVGVKTPLYAFANINVNGKEWGLYLGLEAMEESFAERIYGSDYGMLYKPETVQGGGKIGDKPKGGAEDKNMPNPNDKETSQNTNGEKSQNMPPNMREALNGEVPDMGQMPNGAEPPNMENMPDQGDTTNKQKPNMENMPDMKDGQGGPMGQNGPGGQGGPKDQGGGSDLVYTDDKISSYSSIFDSAVFNSTNSDYKRVITALKALNSGEDIEKYVNVDEVLRYFAANTVIVNLDSYISNLKHNYYLYEKDSQISILPWDFNLAFGGFQGGSSTSAVNFPIDTPTTGVDLSERPLIGKLLENSEYKDKYHVYIEKIAEYINSGKAEQRIDEINNLIKDYVKNDATAFYTYEEYEKSIPALKEFISLRGKSILGQLNGTIPSTQEGQKDKTNLINADHITLESLGVQGGGKGGKDLQMQKNNK